MVIPPAAPTLLEPVQADNASITVSFTSSATSTGSARAITGYVVRVQPGGREVSCTARPCTITGLTNGQAYRASVAAINEGGQSGWSQESKDVIPGEVYATRHRWYGTSTRPALPPLA